MFTKVGGNMRLFLIIAVLILGVCLPCSAGDVVSDRLLDAIMQVESGGDYNAVGDSGKAVGCMQIWPIMVKDVNRISGKNYTLKDRYSKQKSFEMCRIFLSHYCKGMSDFSKARCWNFGPKGYRYKCTILYGNKVLKVMRKGK